MPFYNERNKIAIHLRVCESPDYRPKIIEPKSSAEDHLTEAKKEYKELMTRCWAHDQEQRPSFSEVAAALTRLMHPRRGGHVKPVRREHGGGGGGDGDTNEAGDDNSGGSGSGGSASGEGGRSDSMVVAS